MTLHTRISGIPCQIQVDHYLCVEPDLRADNRDDYYGYTEFEFTVLDRRGRRADWLAAKITDDDEDRILREFLNQRS